MSKLRKPNYDGPRPRQPEQMSANICPAISPDVIITDHLVTSCVTPRHTVIVVVVVVIAAVDCCW